MTTAGSFSYEVINMGILKSLFRSRDKPKDTLTAEQYPFLLGPRAASGQIVTDQTAMRISAVYACVRVLAESIAALPLHLYRYTDGKKTKADDNPLYTLIHDEPNPEMTSFDFREVMMTHILLTGNAYAQKIYNGRGELVALWPLNPNRMTVWRNASGQLRYTYTRDADEALADDGLVVTLTPEYIMHIPGLSFDGIMGYSPIEVARNALGLSMAAEEYGSKFFANGASPSGILSHPSVIKDSEKVRKSWQEAFGGSQNSGKVAVLEEGMTYTPISIPPDQAQFLETRKFQIDEIARIYRVPPHMIGDLEKSSFSNIEQQSLEFVVHSLNPWVVRWEQILKKSLLTRNEKKEYFFGFNVDGLLRGDYESRMRGYATARQNGWMSANDIHRLENMDLIPAEEGGDLYLVNGNMVPLGSAGAFAGVDPTAKGGEE